MIGCERPIATRAVIAYGGEEWERASPHGRRPEQRELQPPPPPRAMEPGSQGAQGIRKPPASNCHAMTTLFLPAPSLMHTRGRPSVACLFQSSDDGHRLPVHRLSRLHRIGPAAFFPFSLSLFILCPYYHGSRVE